VLCLDLLLVDVPYDTYSLRVIVGVLDVPLEGQLICPPENVAPWL
jgi:hypothetical protein